MDAAESERLAQTGGRAGWLADIARDCDPIVVADLVDRSGRGRTGAGSPSRRGRQDRDLHLDLRSGPRRHARRTGGGFVRFLEVPVSGTSEQVRQGDGVGLIGGDADTAADVAPVLAALFPQRHHIGKIGDGGRAKLAINLILGLNRLALAEGLVFAERLGLDPAAFLKLARI